MISRSGVIISITNCYIRFTYFTYVYGLLTLFCEHSDDDDDGDDVRRVGDGRWYPGVKCRGRDPRCSFVRVVHGRSAATGRRGRRRTVCAAEKLESQSGLQDFHLAVSIYTVSGKKGATLFLPVTLRNANRFSKFFYHHTLQ